VEERKEVNKQAVRKDWYEVVQSTPLGVNFFFPTYYSLHLLTSYRTLTTIVEERKEENKQAVRKDWYEVDQKLSNDLFTITNNVNFHLHHWC